MGEVAIGRLHLSQVRLVGVDVAVKKVVAARTITASHNQRVGFAGGDAAALPFRDAVFDSVYCVAVLQYVDDVSTAVRELARVTVPNGRVLAVEPDRGACFFYSSAPSGQAAFDASRRYFTALSAARGGSADTQAVGPSLPALFATHGIDPLEVRLFPVAHTWLGAPSEEVWAARRQAVENGMARGAGSAVREAAQAFRDALDTYRNEAAGLGTAFVEIQNTLLFATVGQRRE
jgi:SAM-dependent methyltransferase